ESFVLLALVLVPGPAVASQLVERAGLDRRDDEATWAGGCGSRRSGRSAAGNHEAAVRPEPRARQLCGGLGQAPLELAGQPVASEAAHGDESGAIGTQRLGGDGGPEALPAAVGARNEVGGVRDQDTDAQE